MLDLCVCIYVYFICVYVSHLYTPIYYLDSESEDEETKQKRREAIAAASIDERVFPPTLLVSKPTIKNIENVSKANSIASSSDPDWEWIEDTHSEALIGMYEEIGEISKLIYSLRKDLKKVMGKK